MSHVERLRHKRQRIGLAESSSKALPFSSTPISDQFCISSTLTYASNALNGLLFADVFTCEAS
jgi:hypothetical protein